MKDNADYGVLEQRALPAHPGGFRRDEVIFLYKLEKEPVPAECYLRRIEYWDEKQERLLVFLTNNMRLAASTIAAVYKDRWQIELLFKALKQSLRIKTFVGTTANAQDTDLDGADRAGGDQVFADEGELCVVVIESGGVVTPAIVCIPGSVGVVG